MTIRISNNHKKGFYENDLLIITWICLSELFSNRNTYEWSFFLQNGPNNKESKEKPKYFYISILSEQGVIPKTLYKINYNVKMGF